VVNFFKEGKKMVINTSTVSKDDITGFFGQELNLSGKLVFQGAVRIDGKYEGEIEAKGTLIVGVDAVVRAEIKVDKAIIMGEVRGTVDARERLEIEGKGKIYGDIKTPKLIVNDGAIFEGSCIMSDGKKELPLLLGKNHVNAEREEGKAVAS
jgi:cytoskeletal protein CcmA (bactofilin family)